MAPDDYLSMGTPVTTLYVHKPERGDVANDVPPRFELFLLGDGEKKVTWAPETRVPDAAVFTFNKEDHTLANLLRAKLAKSPNILFSAYKVPHPLFATFELRVQTDGSLTPKDAVIRACGDLIQELQRLDQEFTKEWELKKIAGQGRDGL
ncbi:RBP11-like subunits of RNA polymerase, partial [Aureobasidium melanogenum]